MRYPASEKVEIIELVEQSHLPAKRTLDKLGIPRATFYRWYDRYRESGPEALDDRRSRPDRVWNRIPDNVRRQIIVLALDLPELSPRELAVRFTDEKKYFVSEASVYRLLKALDLITSPAYVVIKAANELRDKTTAINQLWQTDFTYLKITGWGWYYLSTVLDDFSRYIVTWRLGPTMCASDVTATLDQALAASGLDRATVVHRPRLLSDNGSSYVANDLAAWLEDKGIEHVRITRRPRGKSNGGTRPSRTASCSTTIICPEISNGRSMPSSSITTTSATMRASTTSPRPTFTSAGPIRSSQSANASSATPSQTDACSTSCGPLKL
jgi:putative transposase